MKVGLEGIEGAVRENDEDAKKEIPKPAKKKELD